MNFDYVRNRGIMDRSCPLIKVPMLRTYSYIDALKKVVEYVHKVPYNTEKRSYYLADSTGAMLCDESAQLEVVGDNEQTQRVPWTVGIFLTVSVRFPSRARFYIVEKAGTFLNYELHVYGIFVCNVEPCPAALGILRTTTSTVGSADTVESDVCVPGDSNTADNPGIGNGPDESMYLPGNLYTCVYVLIYDSYRTRWIHCCYVCAQCF